MGLYLDRVPSTLGIHVAQTKPGRDTHLINGAVDKRRRPGGVPDEAHVLADEKFWMAVAGVRQTSHSRFLDLHALFNQLPGLQV